MRVFNSSFLALILVAALSVAGCGTGNNSTPTPTPTPPAPNTVGDFTWMGGSQQYLQLPTSSWPGATELESAWEYSPNAWTDSSGNLWMFGGGIDTNSFAGHMNTMWKMVPNSNYSGIKWTAVSGSITLDTTTCGNNDGDQAAAGVWGTEGQASASNTPSGRFDPATWADKDGSFWLFGGQGCDETGIVVNLSDLWKFNPTAGEWTWMNGDFTGTPPNYVTGSGSGNAGVYGTEGIAAAGNTPGGRFNSATWTDSSGNLWLFGGYGCDSTDNCYGVLNDLWEYSLGTNMWTWVSGSNTNSVTNASVNGVYGTLGIAEAGNTPGGREDGTGWTDASGNLWLYNGYGIDSVGRSFNWLYDIWEYSITTGEWTWQAGSNVGTWILPASYGTKGRAAATNTPGSRLDSANCADSSGNLWIFGGDGDPTGTPTGMGEMNDLWKFDPTTLQWTWEAGGTISDTYGATGSYGTEGVASASNVPMARENSACWFDKSGDLWFFGGAGYQLDTGHNDLWYYQVK